VIDKTSIKDKSSYEYESDYIEWCWLEATRMGNTELVDLVTN
jgi:hypothetical protein